MHLVFCYSIEKYIINSNIIAAKFNLSLELGNIISLFSAFMFFADSDQFKLFPLYLGAIATRR